MRRPLTYKQYRAWGHGPFDAFILSLDTRVVILLAVTAGLCGAAISWWVAP
jgi:hypothetical protein